MTTATVRTKTPEDRFWARVDKDGPLPAHRPDLGPCWVWTAGKNSKGYGQFKVHKRQTAAHRVAYEFAFGPTPEGIELDHLCRNRACVRTTHLDPVTGKVNILRGVGLAALNARKTHCPQGHTYDLFNTYRGRDGERHCRECGRQASVEYRRRRSKP